MYFYIINYQREERKVKKENSKLKESDEEYSDDFELLPTEEQINEGDEKSTKHLIQSTISMENSDLHEISLEEKNGTKTIPDSPSENGEIKEGISKNGEVEDAAQITSQSEKNEIDVLFQPKEPKVNDPESYQFKIVDFGNACWIDQHFTDNIQTRQYRAPEVILGLKYGSSCDMWSMGCMAFELATGDLLFEPKSGHSYDKDDDHLAQMIELLGKIPKRFVVSGKYSRDFFNRRGELRAIRDLQDWTLENVLTDKYKWDMKEAKEMADFILPMLEFIPEKRGTAAQMLKHKWIQDVPPFI